MDKEKPEKGNMSSTDDTQETTSAQDNTQETRETTCATDNTQDTIESAESPYYSLFADDLLEETIKELRPRLLEFMKRFREQQGQMQCLKNEIADLRRSQENLAEFATVESSDSNSRCGSVTSCNKTRNERLKSFANAVKTLLKHTKAAKTQSAEFCGMNRKKALEEARTELNMVEATFGELEDVYQEEQQKLYRYQQRVESLKEKLCKAREEIQRKAMSGDVPFGPCSPDSLTRFPAIVDSYHTGSIVLDSLSLLFNGEEPITAKFNAAGLFHRGKHKVKSQILDENGREHASWHWTLKVVKDV
ncbi:hypothetical protein ANCCEY_05051 [Ancylostoma ceylanicum]|uniref:Uncharacterized protein n=1 Tax=Ancylostoma ceylanicum TaxID=53326 RepID=A0A0D6LUY0_9BILA|nr:hypothetical protein ANCCEY_05051 [Ancylostoma ceylanicum]